MSNKQVYHGWILVEEGSPGFKSTVTVEWVEGDVRKRFDGHDATNPNGWRGESGCAQAVEWWDKRVGKPINLLPFLRGSYRVYTT